MTANTHATIVDEEGNTRKINTEPFTNYNILVFDKSLKNNSYISFINTNVYKGSWFFSGINRMYLG